MTIVVKMEKKKLLMLVGGVIVLAIIIFLVAYQFRQHPTPVPVQNKSPIFTLSWCNESKTLTASNVKLSPLRIVRAFKVNGTSLCEVRESGTNNLYFINNESNIVYKINSTSHALTKYP